MNENLTNSLPDFLQHVERSDDTIENRVIDLLTEVDNYLDTTFAGVDKVKDFVAEFQKLFVAGVSYVQDQVDRLDPKLLSDGKIACNMAALVMGSWVEQHKPLHGLAYLVKRGKQRNHTILSILKDSGMLPNAGDQYWKKIREDIVSKYSTGKEKYGARFYRLTEDQGLFQMSDLADAMDLVSYIDAPHQTGVPQRGYVFTSSHQLARYLITDKEYRNVDLDNSITL